VNDFLLFRDFWDFQVKSAYFKTLKDKLHISGISGRVAGLGIFISLEIWQTGSKF